MYVKKGWYGLPVVLLLLFLLAGCVHQMATKDDTSDEKITKQEPTLKKYPDQPKTDWIITKNPHPKVLELREGVASNKNRYHIYFDTIPKNFDKEEAVEIAKLLLKCPPQDDFIYYSKEHFLNKKFVNKSVYGGWYHKNIEVHDYGFNFIGNSGNTKNRLNIGYIENLDADITDLIDVDSALQIVKAKTTVDLSKSKLCWDNLANKKCAPKTKFYVGLKKHSEIPEVELFWHTLFFATIYDYDHRTFGFTVNAKTGEFKHNHMHMQKACPSSACSKCINNTIQNDASCTDHPNPANFIHQADITLNNYELNTYKPTYSNNCVNFPALEIGVNNGVTYRLYNGLFDNYNINSFTNCVIDPFTNICAEGPQYASSTANTSYTCQEMSVWEALDAINKTQTQAAEHFLNREIFQSNMEYFNNVEPVNAYIGYDNKGAYYGSTDNDGNPFMYLGTGITNEDFSWTDIEIVTHEYTHHLLETYWGILWDRLRSTNESNALSEALCDIYSHYFTENITGSSNWEFAENVANPSYSNSTVLRKLNDPTNSAEPQAEVYSNLWSEISENGLPTGITGDRVPYYKAGVISYWFYLLTEGTSNDPENSPVNGVSLSPNGLGIDRAEKLLFNALEELKRRITNAGFSSYNNGLISFEEFRNTVLDATYEKYINNNVNSICSEEYTQAYRAFQAVGLIGSAVSDPSLNCNVISFDDSNYFDYCPSVSEFSCQSLSNGNQQLTLSFPDVTQEDGEYYIQVFYDDNGLGNFVFEYDFSMDGSLTPLTIGNLSAYMMPPIEIPTITTNVQLWIYNASNIISMPSDDVNIPLEVYTFGCGDQCNLINATDADNTDGPPSPNQGSIAINLSNTTFSTCPTSEICIDYSGNGPAQTFVDINGSQFAQTITNITLVSQSGTFCWTPDGDDVGTHNFEITATDGHPTEPITQTSTVTVNVVDYASEVWSNTSPIFSKTNESSAGANDGSVTVGLGSTYDLEYHWSGPGIPAGTVTYSNWPNGNKQTDLSDGNYAVNVYIYDSSCLYGSYTATVGTNSSGGGSTCQFDPGLIHMRAMPAIFNDQTTIEIELQEKPLQMSLSAFTTQGNPVQNLLSGDVLGVGTHQVTFDGSADPNGLYIFSLAIAVPQCRSGEQETINIKGFKY